MNSKRETRNPQLLIADIGGTNARLALAEAGGTEPVAERYLACADYPGFAPLLADYLAGAGAPRLEAGCLAVAGPIGDDGRRARLTNLPWTIDADTLAARFGIGRLRLANDFAAAAMGITVCPPATLTCLQAGEPLEQAPRLVLGAGTGLGMAILVPAPRGWQVLPGEGGHVAFGPADPEQAELWRYLYARHGRVTAERLISGPGLEAIHAFLAPTAAPLAAAEITARALAEPTSAAGRALDLFLAAYGAFAGDMAMATLARGGVYLAGGIAARLLAVLPGSPFLPAFNGKAEHAHLMPRMPIWVAADPALGLRGAAVLAAG